ncbi:MAG: replication-relaxation family protein [Chloroflexota bacterium]|nr:replication-relaxation family protein [Chloroflexota bacterium]
MNSTDRVLDTIAMMPLISAPELATVCGINHRQAYRALGNMMSDGAVESIPHKLAGAAVERWRLTGNGVGDLAERKGITAEDALRDWPLSAEWERSLLRRLHTVAICYKVAIEALRVEPGYPRWRWERSDVYDAFMTLASGRTFGICRIGPSLSVKSISSRVRALSVLNYREYVSSAVVVTPGPIEQNNLVRRLARTYMSLAVGTEEKVLLGHPGEPAWRTPLYKPLEDFPLEPFIKGCDVRPMPPRRRMPKQASMPKGNDGLGPESIELATSRFGEAGMLLLDTGSNWPLINEDRARRMTGFRSSWYREQRTMLVNSGVLARVRMARRNKKTGGWRLVLTDDGLRLVAWRDRTTLSDLTRGWRIAPAGKDDKAGQIEGYALNGTKLRVAAREILHTDALQELACTIQESCDADPDWTVEQILPTHRWERWFHYNNRRYGIRPDATALLKYNERQVALLVEYEQRAMTPSRMLEKVTRYNRYFGSLDTGLDFASPPVAVMVFPDTASASRFVVHLSRALVRPRRGRSVNRFRMLTSSLEDINKMGFTGTAWWDPMHIGEGMLTLHKSLQRMYVWIGG